MDPLMVFPPEIVHQIWSHLEPADLLAARAVAPHWLASITDCPGAWVTEFSHDWTEFLAVKKALRSWSSKNVRRQTVRNVRDCLFTEFAYYLLFGDGTLEMFSPSGNSVRTFHRPVTDLHRAAKCLLIGVDEKPKASDHPTIRHHTIIADFVFNYIDDMFDIEIIASSPNGYSYSENGECFFSIGPEIPGAVKMPCALDAQLQFLASCAVSVDGFTVKTVQFFDADTMSSTNLKTSTSSPRWIPSVEIIPGPEDYFSIIVEQRDFNTISVYKKGAPLFEDCYPSACKCFFTTDYFFMFVALQESVTAFKLTDFARHYRLDLPVHFNIKKIMCESWSLVQNTLAVFHLNLLGASDSTRWKVYRLSEICTTSSTGATHHPKLQLLADNSTCEMRVNGGSSVSEFEICPGYAFKIQSPKSSSSGNERVIHLLHFDL